MRDRDKKGKVEHGVAFFVLWMQLPKQHLFLVWNSSGRFLFLISSPLFFSLDVHNIRNHKGQGSVARRLRSLLHSETYPSEIAREFTPLQRNSSEKPWAYFGGNFAKILWAFPSQGKRKSKALVLLARTIKDNNQLDWFLSFRLSVNLVSWSFSLVSAYVVQQQCKATLFLCRSSREPSILWSCPRRLHITLLPTSPWNLTWHNWLC